MKNTIKIFQLIILTFVLVTNTALASKVSGNLDSNASIKAAQNNTGGSGGTGGSSTGGGGGSISNSNKPLNQNIVTPPIPQQPQSDGPTNTPPPSNNNNNNSGNSVPEALLGNVQQDTSSGTSSPSSVFTTTNLAEAPDTNSQTAAASDAFGWLDGMNYLWILLTLLIILAVVITYKYIKNKDEKSY